MDIPVRALVWAHRQALEEPTESKEAEEQEEPEQAEKDVKWSQDEKDCLYPCKPLAISLGPVAINDEGETEGVILFSDFFVADGARVEFQEEKFEDCEES